MGAREAGSNLIATWIGDDADLMDLAGQPPHAAIWKAAMSIRIKKMLNPAAVTQAINNPSLTIVVLGSRRRSTCGGNTEWCS